MMPLKAAFATDSLIFIKKIQKFILLVTSPQSRVSSLGQIGLKQSIPYKLLPDHPVPVGGLRAEDKMHFIMSFLVPFPGRNGGKRRRGQPKPA